MKQLFHVTFQETVDYERYVYADSSAEAELHVMYERMHGKDHRKVKADRHNWQAVPVEEVTPTPCHHCSTPVTETPWAPDEDEDDEDDDNCFVLASI